MEELLIFNCVCVGGGGVGVDLGNKQNWHIWNFWILNVLFTSEHLKFALFMSSIITSELVVIKGNLVSVEEAKR